MSSEQLAERFPEWKEIKAVANGLESLQKKVTEIEDIQNSIQALMNGAHPGNLSTLTFKGTIIDLLEDRTKKYQIALKCHEETSRLIEKRLAEIIKNEKSADRSKTTQESISHIIRARSVCYDASNELTSLYRNLLQLELSFPTPTMRMDLEDMVYLEQEFQKIQQQSTKDTGSLTASISVLIEKRPGGFAASFATRILVKLLNTSILEQKQAPIKPGLASFIGALYHPSPPPQPLPPSSGKKIVSQKDEAQKLASS